MTTEEQKEEVKNEGEEEAQPEVSYAEKYPNYKYYEFEDGSLYFGDTVMLTKEEKIIKSLDEITNEEEKAKVKTVRHGFGIMLYDVKKDENGVPISYSSKYEGKWHFDKKQGKGKFFYSDGSRYEGNFDNDFYEGEGKFYSSKGHKFVGTFISGRMEGNGVFTHSDGHKLEGMFKNNYYYCKENDCFIYPYLTKEEVENFKVKNADFNSKTKTGLEKFSRENLIKVYTQTELLKAIDNTIQDNKIPLLIRAEAKNIPKDEIFAFFGENYKEVDLRYFHNQLHKTSFLNIEIYEELKQIVTQAMTKGFFLILNFDDCKESYEYNYDPDIREFYGIMMLSPFMWNPELFIKDKCASAHLNHRDDLKIDKNFKFICYSKFICKESAQEHDLLNFIEKRFEKVFPLVNMNVIIFDSKKEDED